MATAEITNNGRDRMKSTGNHIQLVNKMKLTRRVARLPKTSLLSVELVAQVGTWILEM